MIDKIGPPIAKAFAPIIKLIGKNHVKKEKVIGVVFRDKFIQAAEISYKKGICPIAEDLHFQSYLGFSIDLYDLNLQDIDFIIKSFEKVWKNLK